MAKRIREKNKNMSLLTFRRWHRAKIQPHNGKSITNFLHDSAVQPAQNIYNSSQIVINLQAAQVRRHFYPHFVCWGQKHYSQSTPSDNLSTLMESASS